MYLIHVQLYFSKNKQPSLIGYISQDILQTKILTCITAVQLETNIRLRA